MHPRRVPRTTQPLALPQGETVHLLLPVAHADLEGWQWAAQIRAGGVAGPVVAQWLPGDVEVMPHGVELPLDADVTAGWRWHRGVLGIEAARDGQIVRVWQGPVILDREAVRPTEGTPT